VDSAEFDRFAHEYDQLLRQSVGVTGEGPEFFHEYKIRVLSLLAKKRGISAEKILDFGSGVGNSTPYFRKYFPQSEAWRLRRNGSQAFARACALRTITWPPLTAASM
jgi:predicted O-methyltransferase YrrM